MLHVALYQPKIAPNTGNIGRLCVGMDAHLHVIGPIPFDMSDKAVRRAGLDYWPHLHLSFYESPELFLNWLGNREPWLVTKFGKYRFDEPDYRDGDVLLIGCELTGLPPEWLDRWPDRGIYIPILGEIRSYNQSNATAMIVAQANLKAGRFDGRGPKPRA